VATHCCRARRRPARQERCCCGGETHLDAALPNVFSGEYAGEHWVTTFALLALTDWPQPAVAARILLHCGGW